MDKSTFFQQICLLGKFQHLGTQAEDILGCNIATEGIIGNIIDAYGQFVLDTAAGSRPIQDEKYDKICCDFWNFIVNYDDDVSTIELEDLYKEIESL